MQITEQRTETREVVVGTVCDSCGRDFAEVTAEMEAKIAPLDRSYEYRDETVVRHEQVESSRYEISGTTRTLEVDLCAACTRDKLIPFLRSIGVGRDYRETDW